jgi:hypothetical protein
MLQPSHFLDSIYYFVRPASFLVVVYIRNPSLARSGRKHSPKPFPPDTGQKLIEILFPYWTWTCLTLTCLGDLDLKK